MEMEERLERSNLQTISVPVKDFHWYEENREIVVDGMMFDVKSIERKGDEYIITGLFDKEETDLHIAMGRLQEQEQEGSDTSIIAKMMYDQFYQTNSYSFQNTSIQLSSRPLLTDESLYYTILSLHTPPPRV